MLSSKADKEVIRVQVLTVGTHRAAMIGASSVTVPVNRYILVGGFHRVMSFGWWVMYIIRMIDKFYSKKSEIK